MSFQFRSESSVRWSKFYAVWEGVSDARPTDRKPREPSVVLRRGSIRRSAEEDGSGRVGVYA